MVVTIPYKPRQWAAALHATARRWILLLLHRRAGKTTAILNHLQRDCLRVPGSHFAFIAPTYRQAKRIAWDIAKDISRPIPGVETNEVELTVRYPNGSKLVLYGADNPDALRGIALWGAGFDEFPQQPANIFSEIVSKALADHLGYSIFAGTPKGKNEFFQLFKTAKKSPDWEVVVRTIDDSLRDEKGETIDNLRVALEDDRRLVADNLMTQEEFDQEWYCSFEAPVKGAYYLTQIAAARAQKRIKFVPYDPALPVHTIWDLGIGPAMAVLFVQRVLNEVRIIDYWEGEGKDGMPEAIAAVQRKKYVYGKHFAPHDIKATDMMAGQGKTRKDTALALGIAFEVIPMLSVDEGIALAKLMWARLWISDTDEVEDWMTKVSAYRRKWDEERGMFLEIPYHDFTSHAADTLRYLAVVEKELVNEARVPYTPTPHEPQSEWEG